MFLNAKALKADIQQKKKTDIKKNARLHEVNRYILYGRKGEDSLEKKSVIKLKF